MKSSLRDKVVVVTGASSGIGREAAVQFAERGARVVLAARREAALHETADVCRRAAGSALVIPTDVAVESEVNALVDQTLAHWGRIDVYVNNAGVTYFTPLSEGPFEEHRRVIETNLYGAIYGDRKSVV